MNNPPLTVKGRAHLGVGQSAPRDFLLCGNTVTTALYSELEMLTMEWSELLYFVTRS